MDYLLQIKNLIMALWFWILIYIHENWKRYKNPLEKYFKKSYDIYLKANNQTKGIKTYNLVVDLLVNKYVNSEF